MNRKGAAYIQSILLVLSIISIAFVVGSGVPRISAATPSGTSYTLSSGQVINPDSMTTQQLVNFFVSMPGGSMEALQDQQKVGDFIMARYPGSNSIDVGTLSDGKKVARISGTMVTNGVLTPTIDIPITSTSSTPSTTINTVPSANIATTLSSATSPTLAGNYAGQACTEGQTATDNFGDSLSCVNGKFQIIKLAGSTSTVAQQNTINYQGTTYTSCTKTYSGQCYTTASCPAGTTEVSGTTCSILNDLCCVGNQINNQNSQYAISTTTGVGASGSTGIDLSGLPTPNTPKDYTPTSNSGSTPAESLINQLGTLGKTVSTGVVSGALAKKTNSYADKIKSVLQGITGKKTSLDLATKQYQAALSGSKAIDNAIKTLPADAKTIKIGETTYTGTNHADLLNKLNAASSTAKDKISSTKAAMNSAQNAYNAASKATAPMKDATAAVNKAKTELANAKTHADIVKAKDALKTAHQKLLDATPRSQVGFFQRYTQNFFTKQKFFGEKGANGYALKTSGYIIQTAATAAASALVVYEAAKYLGAGTRNLQQISSAAKFSAAAVTTWASVLKIAGAKASVLPSFGATAAIVIGATLAWTALNYQDFSQEKFTFTNSMWQPPTGGKNCESCNSLPYGCSEYQCHAMGAACGIVNKGTKYQSCDWINKNDMKPPIISQLDNLPLGYSYTPETQVKLPDKGVKITYSGQGSDSQGCIPPFSGITFGVKTDELAQCKIGLQNEYSYNNMTSFMAEGSAYTYNHTISIPSSAFPSAAALNASNLSVDLGSNQNFFIRCMDPNGNVDPYNFNINFCVQKGPDTTPPEVSTNYLNTSYVSFNQTYLDNVEVYTNEPATCRWDRIDVNYKDMAHNMTGCSTKLGDYTFPSTYQYGCHANLTGIKSGETNNYYIRCEDKPWLTSTSNSNERRIPNAQSYKLSLIGTNQLAIQNITINGNTSGSTFKDSTSPVDLKFVVTTSQGAEGNGNARCTYTPQGSNLNYAFYNNGNFDYTYKNTDDIYLDSGAYNYSIKCCDLANNCDSQNVSFNVQVDQTPPTIPRAYYEDGKMKITTDEVSRCVYSTSSCNYAFSDGVAFKTNDGIDHYTPWDTQNDLFIKCQDQYGNLPAPDECQLIVRAYNQFNGTTSSSSQ